MVLRVEEHEHEGKQQDLSQLQNGTGLGECNPPTLEPFGNWTISFYTLYWTMVATCGCQPFTRHFPMSASFALSHFSQNNKQDAVYNCNSDFSPKKNANTSTPFLPLPKNPPKNSTTPRQYRAARALPCGSRPKLLRGPAPPSSTSSAKTRRQGGKLSTRSSFRPGGGWGMGFRCGEIQRVVDLTSRKCHESQVVSSLKSLLFGH